MSDATLDYDSMVQDALRGVVRRILEQTAKDGLIGEHHFYIAFKTQADGVDIPARLMDRFPEEMTIVLQNRFWDLKVESDRFQVGLSFNGQPELLTVPFDAIVGFVDPSVRFALQFHDSADIEDIDDDDQGAFEGAEPALGTVQRITPETDSKSGAEIGAEIGEGIHDAFFLAQAEEGDDDAAAPKAGSKKANKSDDAEDDEPTGGDNVVVALDAFRKK